MRIAPGHHDSSAQKEGKDKEKKGEKEEGGKREEGEKKAEEQVAESEPESVTELLAAKKHIKSALKKAMVSPKKLNNTLNNQKTEIRDDVKGL